MPLLYTKKVHPSTEVDFFSASQQLFVDFSLSLLGSNLDSLFSYIVGSSLSSFLYSLLFLSGSNFYNGSSFFSSRSGSLAAGFLLLAALLVLSLLGASNGAGSDGKYE